LWRGPHDIVELAHLVIEGGLHAGPP